MGIGRLQRQNPVPPGIYWTDLIGPENIQIFADWVLAHPILVRILSYEVFGPLGWTVCPLGEECGADDGRAWVKFQVTVATEWDTRLGFPTIIEPGQDINSASDTVTNPDLSDNCDIACQAKWVVGAIAVTALGGVLLARAIR